MYSGNFRPTRERLAWAGGLFDGEGCFHWQDNRSNSASGPLASLSMSDADSVQRFQAAVGGLGTIRLQKRSHIQTPLGNPYKDMWGWRVSRFEHVQAVIAMLWPFLNNRRKAKAKELLIRFKEFRNKFGSPGSRRGNSWSLHRKPMTTHG